MNRDHKEICRIAYKKVGGKWEEVYKETDEAQVNKWLMHDVIAKKIHKAQYITSIKYRTNYDGTDTYTVYYDGGIKNVYTVER